MPDPDSAAYEELFSVDPADVWFCGRSAMPQIAEAFLDANKQVAATDAQDGAFSRQTNTYYPTGRSSPMEAWINARDELQRIMGETARRVYAAGDALVQTANRYVETDEEAKADFLKVTQEYEQRSTLPEGDAGYIDLEDRDERQNVQMPE